MSIRFLPFHILFYLLIINGLCLAAGEFTGELPPVEIGSSCNDYSKSYLWTTNERTEWYIKEVYTVPVDVASLSDWQDKQLFNETIQSLIPIPATAQHFGNACVSTWTDFVSGSARIEVVVARIVSTTIRDIQCADNVWSVNIESQTSVEDVSDNFRCGDDNGYDVMTTNESELIALLENLLQFVNSQPGATTIPNHTYEER